jgi:ABC-type transport system involved in cytochrome c biogenesis permease subunit
MPKTYFILTAILYWGCFLLRAFLRGKESGKWDRIASIAERLSLLVFTGALVFYITKLQIIDGKVHSEGYDRPVSFLLFAWAICAAHLGTEIVYGNKSTAVFAHLWTALTLTISSAAARFFKGIFTDDLLWLSFHRLCFLVGYAFCVLAFPLVCHFLWLQFRAKTLPTEQKAETERTLWKLDRMSYRMVLWALPLLTAGIIAEGLFLADNHMLPGPAELWTQQRETLLALVTWFICGIYLHTRLFFGWRYVRTAALYLIGLGLVLVGHFSHNFPFVS